MLKLSVLKKQAVAEEFEAGYYNTRIVFWVFFWDRLSGVLVQRNMRLCSAAPSFA